MIMYGGETANIDNTIMKRAYDEYTYKHYMFIYIYIHTYYEPNIYIYIYIYICRYVDRRSLAGGPATSYDRKSVRKAFRQQDNS